MASISPQSAAQLQVSKALNFERVNKWAVQVKDELDPETSDPEDPTSQVVTFKAALLRATTTEVLNSDSVTAEGFTAQALRDRAIISEGLAREGCMNKAELVNIKAADLPRVPDKSEPKNNKRSTVKLISKGASSVRNIKAPIRHLVRKLKPKDAAQLTQAALEENQALEDAKLQAQYWASLEPSDDKLILDLTKLCQYLHTAYVKVIDERAKIVDQRLIHEMEAMKRSGATRLLALENAANQKREDWLVFLHGEAPGHPLWKLLKIPKSPSFEDRRMYLHRLCEKHKHINTLIRQVGHLSKLERRLSIVDNAFPTELLEILGVKRGVVGVPAFEYLMKKKKREAYRSLDMPAIERWIQKEMRAEDKVAWAARKNMLRERSECGVYGGSEIGTEFEGSVIYQYRSDDGSEWGDLDETLATDLGAEEYPESVAEQMRYDDGDFFARLFGEDGAGVGFKKNDPEEFELEILELKRLRMAMNEKD